MSQLVQELDWHTEITYDENDPADGLVTLVGAFGNYEVRLWESPLAGGWLWDFSVGSEVFASSTDGETFFEANNQLYAAVLDALEIRIAERDVSHKN